MADQYAVVTAYTTTLSAPMTATQLTVPVNSVTTKDGHVLTMSDLGAEMYLTLEPGGNSEEIVKIIGISGLNWVVDPAGRGMLYYGSGDSHTTDNAKAHVAGAVVIMSNVKNVYERFVDKEGDEDVGGIKTFTDLPKVPVLPVDDDDVSSKKYVDDTVVAGAPNATTGVKGLVQLASQANNNAGTAIGSTLASLVATPAVAAQTIQNSKWKFAADAAVTDAYVIAIVPAVTAYATGQEFIFTANTANTGAATLQVNSLAVIPIKKNHDQALETGDIESGSVVHVVYDGTNFQMLNQQASMATTASLTEMDTFFGITNITGAQANTLVAGPTSDASSLHMHKKASVIGTRDLSAASGAVTYAHGLGAVPRWTRITGQWSNAADTRGATSYGTFDATNTKGISIVDIGGGPDSHNSTTNIIVLGTGSDYQVATIAADATNVTLTWTKTSTPDGIANFIIETEA